MGTWCSVEDGAAAGKDLKVRGLDFSNGGHMFFTQDLGLASKFNIRPLI